MKTALFIVIIILSNSCRERQSEKEAYNSLVENTKETKHVINESADTSQSSWIQSANYYGNNVEGNLIIEAHNKEYIFKDVPYSVWIGFKSAKSKGKFYHRNIKGKYSYNL